MKLWIHACLAVALAACGHHSNPGTDPDAGGPGSPDATAGPGDPGGPPAGCDPNGPQCNNCIDDDGDGRIDGYDPECTGASDNDEASFATGIPGDNKDPVMQDCFFDGDSGAGNDGCNIHVCCLLGATSAAECPIGGTRYDPDSCPPPLGTHPLSAQCIATCGKLTPPGCDCFGCCTVCDPATDHCYDIAINPADSVGCGPTTLDDPSKCLRCTKTESCGAATCGGETCVLCPGQSPGDLPASCNGTPMCPVATDACSTSDSCGEGGYCSNGCCIAIIF